MSLETKVTMCPTVAILCQNHPIYLTHAAKIGKKYPERLITFRTTALWRSGAKALEAQGPRQIYFAPEGQTTVQYAGVLEQVLLEPQAESAETQALLAHCLPETQDQGLWEQYDEHVRTLYVISHCHDVESPFSYTDLTKISDDEPVSEKYTYGYILVYEYCTTCKRSPCRCPA